ncbi:MAG: hypothetical protein JSV67_03095 [Thermoplasmatales archaeon]|nr:MAG: hypothetical protein JSV67_03095 [Thermoplasmatales archaeon]
MKTKILTIILVTIILLGSIISVIANAKKPVDTKTVGKELKDQRENVTKGPHGRAGRSFIGHLYLFEKNPETWEIIENGSRGKMKYVIMGPTFSFVFNAHKLEPDSNYTLIYYPDPWPGENLICLGDAITNEDGNINIKGSVLTGDLPNETIDLNYPNGSKIWLVLTEDVDCENQKMIGWNPTEYLFEHNLIRYIQTITRNRSWWRLWIILQN